MQNETSKEDNLSAMDKTCDPNMFIYREVTAHMLRGIGFN